MSYYLMREVEKETNEFFRKKYGFFWKRIIKPCTDDEEYYSKFKEILEQKGERA